MSQKAQKKPELPPTQAIEQDFDLRANTQNWFEYPIVVHPHHTDYAGVVWHGTYLTWMEAARIEYLRSIGIEYAELVNLGYELPVVELALRYHKPLNLGMEAIVKTMMAEIVGVRIHWDYRIESRDTQELYLSGRVTLVSLDRAAGKIMRQLPPSVKEAIVKISR